MKLLRLISLYRRVGQRCEYYVQETLTKLASYAIGIMPTGI